MRNVSGPKSHLALKHLSDHVEGLKPSGMGCSREEPGGMVTSRTVTCRYERGTLLNGVWDEESG